MNRRRRQSPIHWVALGVSCLAALVVVMPLRPVEPLGKTKGAAFAPLLASQGVAQSAAFHRLEFQERTSFSTEPLFRKPGAPSLAASGSPRRVLTVTRTVSPIPVDFHKPRQEWNHLTPEVRTLIDSAVVQPGVWSRVQLHGTHSNRDSVAGLARWHHQIAASKRGLAYHFVIGNGGGEQDGQIHVGSHWMNQRTAGQSTVADGGKNGGVIDVALIGDFALKGPTPAQLEALDELLDYLSMKTGLLPVDVHGSGESLSGHTGSCLGPGFPARQLVEELAVGRGG